MNHKKFVCAEREIDNFYYFFHNRINHNYDSQYTYRIINFYVF